MMKTIEIKLPKKQKKQPTLGKPSLWQLIMRDKMYLFMLLPAVIYYIIFKYIPMYGIVIAFQDYNIFKGFLASEWVGFKHFINFFTLDKAWELIRNTFLLNIYVLAFGFPLPIFLAIAFNEIRNPLAKKTAQTISFLPHFISTVVIVGLATNFLSPSSGVINKAVEFFTGGTINFLQEAEYFRSIYVFIHVWQDTGWSSIIYIAAINAVDPTLYEAAWVDGANKLKRTWHVTLPSILPTIVIMLILKLGNILTLGQETILLLYNPLTYEVADVLSTYAYRRGIVDMDYSYAAAIDLFASIVGLIFIVSANKISKKLTENSLW